MIRHATPTEISLYYRHVLNEPDTKWLDAHLPECSYCNLQYELLCQTLDDLKNRKVRKMSWWQKRCMWKRILKAEKLLRQKME